MNTYTKLIAAIALTAFAGAASATIIGNIDFDGGFTGYEADGVTTADNLVAEVFKFENDIDVTAADGSLSFLLGTAVTYSTLDLNAIPASPLWVADATTWFNLESITVDTVSFNTRIVQGVGTLFLGGETATYNWEFSSQGDGSGNPTIFSFSASQANVPEPAIALLLATGLIGFGFARRARKTA